MARIEKTVFISYRRTDVYTALAVYENLKNQGYDIFFDYRSIASGDFEQIISSNIKARAHFLLLLTPGALDRCDDPQDWLRREIELAIDEKRNIIPLFFKGFRFGVPSVTEKLTGKLLNLGRYNGLNVHEDYFDEAMYRLRTEYLNKPLNTILHPVSTEVQRVVKAEQVAADKALEQIEDVKELVKHSDEGSAVIKEPQKVTTSQPGKDKTSSRVSSNTKLWRLIAGSAIGLTIVALCALSGSLISNRLLSSATGPAATPSLPASATSNEETSPASATQAATDTLALALTIAATHSPSPEEQATRTALLATVLANLATTRADQATSKDGMTLLYVPAGEFTMGSNNGELDERPMHTVHLDAFWIDETEVTVGMYYACVEEDVCEAPKDIRSRTHAYYFYPDGQFINFPVIYVDWEMAKTYCEWADRRLPTEAEWEKAASWDAGNRTKLLYPWGDLINCNFANYGYAVSYCTGDTTKVASYERDRSPYGAFDMAGNVSEWVADWYGETYYASSPASNPPGPVSGQYRVLRGGSWGSPEYYVRATSRVRAGPGESYGSFGFRCAMDATP